MLKQLINLFIKKNGRSPNAIEMLQLKFKAAQQSGQSGKGEVIQFPKDRITDWTKAKSRPPETEIIDGIQTTRGFGDLFGRRLEKIVKKVKKGEVIDASFAPGKDAKGKMVFMSDKDFKDLQRGFRLNLAKNSREFNEEIADRIIKREMYENVNDSQRKLLLNDLDQVLKEPKAEGGRAGFQTGGLPAVDPRMLNTYEENKAANREQAAANYAARFGEQPAASVGQTINTAGQKALETFGYTPEHTAAVDRLKKDATSQFDYARQSGKDLASRGTSSILTTLGQTAASPIYDAIQAADEYSKKGYQGEFGLSKQGVIDFGKNLGALGKEVAAQKIPTMMAGRTLGGLEAIGERLGADKLGEKIFQGKEKLANLLTPSTAAAAEVTPTQQGVGRLNIDGTLVQVGIDEATGFPEWAYPNEAAEATPTGDADELSRFTAGINAAHEMDAETGARLFDYEKKLKNYKTSQKEGTISSYFSLPEMKQRFDALYSPNQYVPKNRLGPESMYAGELVNHRTQPTMADVAGPALAPRVAPFEKYGITPDQYAMMSPEEQDEVWRKVERDKSQFFAQGGLAPMLGEPTYQDEDHRIPLSKGGSGTTLDSDTDWDDMDPDEWFHILKLLKAGEVGAAEGGRVPLKGGKFLGEGLPAAIAYLRKKFGKDIIKKGELSKPMADKTELKRAIAGFREREKAAKLKVWNDPDKVRAAVDDIFSTGDYKMDAEMAAEALVENNPAAFGGKLIDDIDDATRSEIYGAVLRVVQSDLAKMLQLKRLSRPTKTLEGIKKTGKINISDEGVADEFTRFMKETDPKGHKKLEQTVDLMNLDPKGKKGHATGGRVSLSSGGLAGMLGE